LLYSELVQQEASIMKQFTDKRRVLWLAGIGVLVLGLLAAFVVLPMRAGGKGAEGPAVDVPKMQNVPPETAPKLNLDVNEN
jgi:hypothetical protein